MHFVHASDRDLIGLLHLRTSLPATLPPLSPPILPACFGCCKLRCFPYCRVWTALRFKDRMVKVIMDVSALKDQKKGIILQSQVRITGPISPSPPPPPLPKATHTPVYNPDSLLSCLPTVAGCATLERALKVLEVISKCQF